MESPARHDGGPLVMHGIVTSFDVEAGHGIVTGDDQAERFFHCTAIADGTRTVDLGAKVVFTVVPGRGGAWEAVDIAPT